MAEDYPKRGIGYMVWRKKVFKLWGRRCCNCGSRAYLHAHHVLSWSKYPEKRFDVFNSTVLCVMCHSKLHPYMKKDFKKEISRINNMNSCKKTRKQRYAELSRNKPDKVFSCEVYRKYPSKITKERYTRKP